MRAPLALTLILSLSTGCTAYMKSQHRTAKSARREAGQLALGAVAQVVVGTLVIAGSHYLYRTAEPPPPQDERVSVSGQRLAGALGIMFGGGIIVSGVGDSMIALYQLLSGDYVLPPPYRTQIKPVAAAPPVDDR